MGVGGLTDYKPTFCEKQKLGPFFPKHVDFVRRPFGSLLTTNGPPFGNRVTDRTPRLDLESNIKDVAEPPWCCEVNRPCGWICVRALFELHQTYRLNGTSFTQRNPLSLTRYRLSLRRNVISILSPATSPIITSRSSSSCFSSIDDFGIIWFV